MFTHGVAETDWIPAEFTNKKTLLNYNQKNVENYLVKTSIYESLTEISVDI